MIKQALILKKTTIISGIMFVCLLVGTGLFCLSKNNREDTRYDFELSNQRQEMTYQETEEVLYNPFMGFAPDADYPEIVGDNTLVYMEMTWAEIEPEAGIYAFDDWEEENYYSKWKAEGKKVVFRLICDLPDEYEHSDIPQWLMNQTGDGVFYDTEYGMGYAPNYENQTLIDAHEKLIKALGDRYGQDDYFYYVEFGSLGHWGEFHVKSDENLPLIPSEEICQKYLLPYLEAFPHAKFLMRRPYHMAAENGTGLYNDMIGAPDDTMEWLDWIAHGGCYDESVEPLLYQVMPEQYMIKPVGGEFTSSIPMKDMLTVNGLDSTLSLLKESHTTFIGPKIPEEQAYIDGTEAVQKTIGYRIGVRKASFWKDEHTNQLQVELVMDNQGAAPFYEDWPVCLYLYDAKGKQIKRVKTDISLQNLKPDGEEIATAAFDLGNQDQNDESYKIYIGIENPSTGLPSIAFNMDVENQENQYLLGQTIVM